ncbi:MAG: sortase [Oscillospiraceae bacterium]
MKKSKRGIIFIAVGALLLIAALSLIVYNSAEDKRAAQKAESALVEIKKEIAAAQYSAPEEQPTADGTGKPTADIPAEEEEEKAVELDGEWYIGMITVPKVNVELPVLRDWSYPNLAIAPCRYSGHAASGDLIIAAHNYSSFFADLDKLTVGDEIIYTSLSGQQRSYKVVNTELISGEDGDSLFVGDDYWDITLFTCTWSGYSRVAVRAEFSENAE